MSTRRSMGSSLALWAVGVVGVIGLAASSSCTILLGTFEGTGGAETSSSSSNPSAGTMSTTGPSGSGASTTSTSGTGGTGGGQGGCMSVAGCPTPPNACVQATCTAGVCGTQDAPMMILMQHSPPDCKAAACDGMGNPTTVVDMTNLPTSTNPCLVGTCDASGNPGTTTATSGTSCSGTTNGKLCDGVGDCVQCLHTSDCTAGESCDVTHTCVMASCSDGVQDNAETDVDCGGGTCGPCPDLKMCLQGSDCIDKICTANTCAQPTCSDGVTNGNETDTDCGGGMCGACGPSKTCKANSDCIGTQCGGGTCTPNCMDHVQNNTETDVDCGGGGCATCADGKKCVADPDCTSDACDTVSLTCVASQCSDHRVDGLETDVDCGGGTCGACALTKNCKVDTDCISMACDSQSLTCVSSQCSDHQKDGLETDIDCGGGTCGACATGKKCKIDADCLNMACSVSSLTCIANQCADGSKDGNETDIDCGGGGACPACPTGKGCKVNTDCTTSACDMVVDKCVVSTCVDERVDGSETDVDCGGSCSPCPNNKKCMVDTDCTSNACDAVALTCIANQCADHQKDGLETAVDCGGGICTGCPLGDPCALDVDCASNACDGVSAVCVASQCSDHRQDGNETDVDCGGVDSCNGCAVGRKCNVNADCQVGHTCSAGTPHVCQ